MFGITKTVQDCDFGSLKMANIRILGNSQKYQGLMIDQKVLHYLCCHFPIILLFWPKVKQLLDFL